MPSDLELLNHATHLLESRTRLALCTVVEKKGSGPRDVGAKMIVTENGKTYGTIGGGNLERSLIEECLKTIKEGKSRKLTFNLTENQKEGMVGTGMVCGGELTVLADVMEPAPRLIIIGTGHVGLPLATLASCAGFEITIVDDERKLASKEQFPMAENILAGDYAQVLGTLELGSRDYVVIANGEPEHDYTALQIVIVKGAAYVGLLGSKTKAAILTKKLNDHGISELQLKALHAPLGLDIGAENPEEIAISILAQIIQLRRKPQP
jgi:xanthine dehydrogenase accessory factor